MKTEIKYKVVTNIEGSVTVRGRAYIRYIKGKYVTSPKWLRGQGYYPFVFNNSKSAIEFANEEMAGQVFKARVKGRHKKRQLPERFYNASLAHGVCRPVPMVFPEGTEMWEFVKLLEKIK